MWIQNEEGIWQYLDENTGEVVMQLGPGESPPQYTKPWAQEQADQQAFQQRPGNVANTTDWRNASIGDRFGALFGGQIPQSTNPPYAVGQGSPPPPLEGGASAGTQDWKNASIGQRFGALMGNPSINIPDPTSGLEALAGQNSDNTVIQALIGAGPLGMSAIPTYIAATEIIKGIQRRSDGSPTVVPQEEWDAMSEEEKSATESQLAAVAGQNRTPPAQGAGGGTPLGNTTGAPAPLGGGSGGLANGGGSALGSGQSASGGGAGGGVPTPATAGTAAQEKAKRVIEGMAQGPASRELLKTDPESFVSLLIEEASGSTGIDPAMQAFIVGQSDLLYQVADLMGMADMAYGNISDYGDNIETLFESKVAPGGYDLTGAQNVMRLIAEAKPVIEENAIAQAQNTQSRGGNTASAYFDGIYDMVASVIAPTVSPGVRQAFGSARKAYERTKYYAAKVKGEFTGTPLDWMVYRSIISLANGVPGPMSGPLPDASKATKSGAGTTGTAAPVSVPDMSDVDVYSEAG